MVMAARLLLAGTLRNRLKQPGDDEGDSWDYDVIPLRKCAPAPPAP